MIGSLRGNHVRIFRPLRGLHLGNSSFPQARAWGYRLTAASRPVPGPEITVEIGDALEARSLTA